MLRNALLLGACLVVFTIAASVDAATVTPITVGQTDNFEDGTTNGWVGGAILTNTTGGPTGRYLTIATNTDGKGHWGARNPNRWGGGMSTVYRNYITNGIRGIAMDLNNFGPEPLAIRLMFVNGAEEWASTNIYDLPANSGWQHVVFGITAADLTRVQGTGIWSQTMSYVQKMAIHHDPGLPSPDGEAIPIEAVVGMDNVTAVLTPEPASVLLLAAGAAALLRRRRAA